MNYFYNFPNPDIMLKITAYFYVKSYNYFKNAFKLNATEIFNNLFFISSAVT